MPYVCGGGCSGVDVSSVSSHGPLWHWDKRQRCYLLPRWRIEPSRRVCSPNHLPQPASQCSQPTSASSLSRGEAPPPAISSRIAPLRNCASVKSSLRTAMAAGEGGWEGRGGEGRGGMGSPGRANGKLSRTDSGVPIMLACWQPVLHLHTHRRASAEPIPTPPPAPACRRHSSWLWHRPQRRPPAQPQWPPPPLR